MNVGFAREDENKETSGQSGWEEFKEQRGQKNWCEQKDKGVQAQRVLLKRMMRYDAGCKMMLNYVGCKRGQKNEMCFSICRGKQQLAFNPTSTGQSVGTFHVQGLLCSRDLRIL